MKYRTGRLGEEIRRIISDLLLRELKDPRLQAGIVSISGVDVTSDCSYATVYLATMVTEKSEEEKEKRYAEVLEAFRSAKGLIRREIGRQVKMRHVPDLIFKVDRSLDYGMHISEVISGLNIKHEDEESNDEEE